jgi:hypothetical protein
LRKIALDDLKSAFADSKADAAPLFRYQLKTTYIKGKNGKKTKYEKVKNFDSVKDIYMPDGDDNFSVFPRLDITDGI